jgi:hypothetical protein
VDWFFLTVKNEMRWEYCHKRLRNKMLLPIRRTILEFAWGAGKKNHKNSGQLAT